MNGAGRIAGLVVAVAGLGWLGWMPVRSMYLDDRAELQRNIVTAVDLVDRYRSGRDDHGTVSTAIRAFVDRTLGGDLETVDHELRTRLNRLGEEIGLAKLSVSTGSVRWLESPARSLPAFRGHRELREEIDFVEVEASITGEGALDEVLRLVHRIEAEPWLKRVNQLRLNARDNGERFMVTLRLVTIFLPGRSPAGTLHAITNPGAFDRYNPLVDRNPFHLPPKTAETPPPEAAAPQPAKDPPGTWVLTGVVTGPGGVEVWLLDTNTGDSRRLAIGQTLEMLTLVSAAGETAEFALGDRRFTVQIGGRLR